MSTATSRKRILIVEDEQPIRAALVELFADEGYDVLAAANGAEALAMLRTAAVLPGVILLDLIMPVKDGNAFRAEQELDPRLAKIPVVLMSADKELEIKTIRIGLHYHARKPLDVDSLLATVKSLAE